MEPIAELGIGVRLFVDFNWTDWYGPPSFLLLDPQIFVNLAYAYVSN